MTCSVSQQVLQHKRHIVPLEFGYNLRIQGFFSCSVHPSHEVDQLSYSKCNIKKLLLSCKFDCANVFGSQICRELHISSLCKVKCVTFEKLATEEDKDEALAQVEIFIYILALFNCTRQNVFII